MNKDAKLKIILGCLAAVMLAVWARTPGGPSSRRNASGGMDGSASEDPQEWQSLVAMTFAEGSGKRSSHAQWGRSPFTLSLNDSAPSNELNGILWDPVSPKALINGQIVGVGDSVGAATVVEIKQSSVILDDGTRDVHLRLGE